MQLAFAESTPRELAFENETFSTTQSVSYLGSVYEIVTYQNGDNVLFDSSGSLVTNTDTLNGAYLISGYQQAFSKYGITEAKYSALPNAISNYRNSLGVLTNPASATVLGLLGAGLGTIALPVVGTVSGAAIIGALIFVAGRLGDTAKTPQSTADQILADFAQIKSGQATPKTYENVLTHSDQFKSQMKDWESQFIVLGNNVWGSLGDIIYKIGDAGANLWGVGDISKQIRSAGDNMIESQTTFSTTLEWLSTWNANQVKEDATSIAQKMMDSQKQRIRSLQSNFETLVGSVKDAYTKAQHQANEVASQGADISYANVLLQQSSSKIEQATSEAGNYQFKTARSILGEATNIILNSQAASNISLTIHKAEVKIAEAQNIISQKTANGADTQQAQAKLDSAKTSLSSAKNFLTSANFESAISQSSNALSMAQEAKNLADSASIPSQLQTATSIQTASTVTQQNPEASVPLGYVILAFVAVALIVIMVRRHVSAR